MRIRPLHLALAAMLAVSAFATSAGAMTFEKVSDVSDCAQRTCVVASGLIEADTADRFAYFVRSNAIPRGALVVLESGGGNVMAGLKMADAIRTDGFSTTVQSYDRNARRFVGGACASACAYVFLGGVERSVGRGSLIGVHQVAAADPVWAMNTHPRDMHWLSDGELTRYAVVTAASAAS